MAASIVPEVLTGRSNYARWSACMKNYFIAHDDIWGDAIEGRGDPEEHWKKKNVAALHAIGISCSPGVFSQIRDVTSAKLCWRKLAQICTAESSVQADDVQGTKGNELTEFQPMCKAIEEGDLNGVKRFLDLHEDAINQKITKCGSKTLHLASSTGNTELVKELLELMSDV